MLETMALVKSDYCLWILRGISHEPSHKNGENSNFLSCRKVQAQDDRNWQSQDVKVKDDIGQ